MSEQEQFNSDTGEIIVGRPPFPPKVAAAIAAVMAEVPKLGKGERNQHGNYNFASIDDFLEAVRPLCAKHGLIILQDEESFEMREGWLVMRFAFTLAHASGETWGHRPVRTTMVSAKMGAQAFGAAQSYALKQFERALFQIATGEKDADADSHPPADLPNGRGAAPRPTPSANVRRGNAQGLRQQAAAQSPQQDSGLLQTYLKQIQEQNTEADLKAWKARHLEEIKAQLSDQEREALNSAYAEKLSKLPLEEAA